MKISRIAPGRRNHTSLPLAPLPFSDAFSSFSALLRDEREGLHHAQGKQRKGKKGHAAAVEDMQ